MQRIGRNRIPLLAILALVLATGGLFAQDPPEAPPDSTLVPPGPAAAPAPPQEGTEEVIESGDSVDTVRTGLYRGKVTNRKSGKPVGEAVLIFMNEESGDTFQVTTDEAGVYEIRLPAGEYVVDIRVGRKTYRSTGTFREEATGQRWVMDFTVGSKLTDKDLKIQTTPRDIRVVTTEPRPPLEPSRKTAEFLIFLGGLLGVAALVN